MVKQLYLMPNEGSAEKHVSVGGHPAASGPLRRGMKMGQESLRRSVPLDGETLMEIAERVNLTLE